jgi:hypothetical protein
MAKKKPMIVLNEQAFPNELVALDSDGTETHWRLHRTSMVKPLTRDVEQTADGEYRVTGGWDACEWLVRSQYRESRCGRGGYDDGYGMSLCWQHQDALMIKVLHRLRHRQWHLRQVEDFAEALATSNYVKPPFADSLHVASPAKKMLEAALIDSIDNVIDDPDIVSEEVLRAITRLVERRLAERLEDHS